MTINFKRATGLALGMALALGCLVGVQAEAKSTKQANNCPSDKNFEYILGDNGGYAWSANVGYIIFDDRVAASSLGVEGGQEAISSYSVDMCGGQLWGFAWSPYLGWLYFGDSAKGIKVGAETVQITKDSKVDVAGYTRHSNGTDAKFSLTGYALFLSGANQISKNSCTDIGLEYTRDKDCDGWDGKLSLSGDDGGVSGNIKYAVSNYPDWLEGVTMEGYAWSDSVVGWTDFSKVLDGIKDDCCVGSEVLLCRDIMQPDSYILKQLPALSLLNGMFVFSFREGNINSSQSHTVKYEQLNEVDLRGYGIEISVDNSGVLDEDLQVKPDSGHLSYSGAALDKIIITAEPKQDRKKNENSHAIITLQMVKQNNGVWEQFMLSEEDESDESKRVCKGEIGLKVEINDGPWCKTNTALEQAEVGGTGGANVTWILTKGGIVVSPSCVGGVNGTICSLPSNNFDEKGKYLLQVKVGDDETVDCDEVEWLKDACTDVAVGEEEQRFAYGFGSGSNWFKITSGIVGEGNEAGYRGDDGTKYSFECGLTPIRKSDGMKCVAETSCEAKTCPAGDGPKPAACYWGEAPEAKLVCVKDGVDSEIATFGEPDGDGYYPPLTSGDDCVVNYSGQPDCRQCDKLIVRWSVIGGICNGGVNFSDFLKTVSEEPVVEKDVILGSLSGLNSPRTMIFNCNSVDIGIRLPIRFTGQRYP